MKKILFALILITIFTTGFNYSHKSTKNQQIKSDYMYYVVKQGDCISTIAEKYKGNKKLTNMIAEIQFANNIDEIIHAGDVIKIPLPLKN